MTNEIFTSELNADVNFYKNICSFDAEYSSFDEVKHSRANFNKNSFSVLRVNKSINKNFGIFKTFFKLLQLSFSVLCLSKTWCDSLNETKKATLFWKTTNQYIKIRNFAKAGEGVCIYLGDDLFFKIRDDLNKCSEEIK